MAATERTTAATPQRYQPDPEGKKPSPVMDDLGRNLDVQSLNFVHEPSPCKYQKRPHGGPFSLSMTKQDRNRGGFYLLEARTALGPYYRSSIECQYPGQDSFGLSSRFMPSPHGHNCGYYCLGNADVRFGSLADITAFASCPLYSGHSSVRVGCPMSAISDIRRVQRIGAPLSQKEPTPGWALVSGLSCVRSIQAIHRHLKADIQRRH